MRWLTRSLLVSLALGLVSHVEASCKAGPVIAPANGGDVNGDVPDTNALTLFVTTAIAGGVMNGNFLNFANAHSGIGSPNPSSPVFSDTDPLIAADHICTYYAANPGNVNLAYGAGSSTTQPYYNQDTSGHTVQFKALVSSDTTDAISRFSTLNNVNIVDSFDGPQRNCLAANISDLLSGNYAYSTAHFYDQNGNTFSSGTQVWTGTGAVSTNTADINGGRYHAVGQAVNSATGFCFASGNSWNTASGGVSGAFGAIYDNSLLTGAPNRWIYDDSTTGGLTGCSQGLRLYCISAQTFAPAPPNVGGDPQFVGLQGQHFQVHGMPDEFFNLITTPAFQLNSRFTYLASGSCTYNNTECWTHPGTYVDQLGFMFPGVQIRTVAGPHHKGLRVWVNDEEMSKHTKLRVTSTTSTNTTETISIRHPHHDTVILSSSLYTIEITNSDWFFNFNLQFHVPEILAVGKMLHYIADSRMNHGAVDHRYPAYPMHGLVGQTWKNARYPAKRMYQGDVDDYMLMDHTLFSSQFAFNLYQY